MSLVPSSSAIESGGYNIDRSLRFRSSASAYLNRTPASASNRTTWTYSKWVKRGQLGSTYYPYLLMAFQDSSNYTYISIDGDALRFSSVTAGSMAMNKTSSAVLRDPSAWYYITIVADTTNATAEDRARMYINGVRVTSFASSTNPAQNALLHVNNNIAHTIAKYATDYFDGYLAEVNFIDGQALTPSSFGQTDATTGVWQPAKYTGTYGTNGFYLPFSLQSQSTYAGSFNGTNQYLTATSASAFDFGSGDFTIEGWFYVTGKSTRHQAMVLKGSPTTNNAYDWRLYWGDTGNNELWFDCAAFSFSGAASSNDLVLNAWNHIAVTRNGSSGRMFLNGNLAYAAATATGSIGNSYTTLVIGAGNVGAAGQTYFTGNMSNLRIVKGTSLYNAPFVPPSQPLTAVSGTQILTLQDSSIVDNSSNALTITNNNTVTTATATPFANPDLTADYSGNNNNWQKNNISLTAGATYDSMTDVPTLTSATAANYCVLNPIAGASVVSVTNGNLTASEASASGGSRGGTFGVSSGKWYWEVTPISTYSIIIGAYTSYETTSYNLSGYGQDGNKYQNQSPSAYGSTFVAGDVIGVALDLDSGTLGFYKNGVNQGTAFTGLTGTWFPAIRLFSTSANFNFGQRPFSYTPPTGFKALNTFNLPDPTIKKPNQYMDATLYTGNGGALTVTNNGFQPDLIWAKSRSGTYWHGLWDSVRGSNNLLYSNATDAENNASNLNMSVNSTGWSMNGANSSFNANGSTQVGWQWKESATAGFDIVTYTGTGSARTVSHSLGVAPKMIICKVRSDAGYDWNTYHASLGATKYLSLNSTSAAGTSSSVWNNTEPTSSVFSVANNGGTNQNGATLVAYLFAEIAGFSAFGSYTGNGSTDGPFVYCGFRPKYVMVKRTVTDGYPWVIRDAARNPYNTTNLQLEANSSGAEATPTNKDIDFVSNGFKIRGAGGDINDATTYIYAAFAENPFKYANAR